MYEIMLNISYLPAGHGEHEFSVGGDASLYFPDGHAQTQKLPIPGASIGSP